MGFNGKNKDMPLYLNVFGPNKNEYLWRWGYNLGAADKFKVKQNWTMQVNTVYHIRYCFDTKKGLIEMLVTRGNNIELQLFGDPKIKNMTVGQGNFFSLDLGFDGSNPAEPPILKPNNTART